MLVKIEASRELIEAINALAHSLNNLSASLNLEVEQAAEQEVARRMEEIQAEAATEKKEQTVSLEQVREKLAALVKAGKQEQVKELIASYGASKLTEIPAEKYAELLEKAEAIA